MRRSPDHGTVEVVVVVVVGTIFNFDFFRDGYFYKRTFVGNINVMNIFVFLYLCDQYFLQKNAKNDLTIFIFSFFWHFDLSNALKIWI